MKRGPSIGAGAGVSMASALTAWGENMPDWVAMLARMADRSSQTAVSREIGYAGSTVNQIINNSYGASTTRIEQAVRGRFLAETVNCPVLGELAANVCLSHQKLAVNFSASSSLRVRLARACKGACPNSHIGRQALPKPGEVEG